MAAFSTPLQRQRDAAGARSCPALAGAFQLEKVAFKKRLLAMEYTREPERVPLETVKDRERRRRTDERLEKMRQREEDERGLVVLEKKRQKNLREAERSRRLEAERKVEDMKRQELVKKWTAEQAVVKARDQQRLEECRREEEERERRAAEEEESDRLQRIPVLCSTCKNSGLCTECNGAGAHSATFLAPHVQMHPLEFGTKTRGCTGCFGCDQGIRGELQRGSGICTTCGGVGKFCTGFCQSRVMSAKSKTRASTSIKEKEDEEATQECKECGGAIRPSLEDARLVWELTGEPEQREHS